MKELWYLPKTKSKNANFIVIELLFSFYEGAPI